MIEVFSVLHSPELEGRASQASLPVFLSTLPGSVMARLSPRLCFGAVPRKVGPEIRQ